MKNWLKYNLNQNTLHPISIKEVIGENPSKCHEIMFEQAKNMALIHYVDENDSYVFLNEITETTNIEELLSFGNVMLVAENLIETDNIENAKYFIDLDEWKFTEINAISDDFASPPKLKCIRRNITKNLGHPSFEKYTIDLSPWWDMEYIKNLKKKYDMNLTNNVLDEYPFAEIINYDYVNEMATLENRVEMNKRKVSFAHLNDKCIPNIIRNRYGK